MKQSAILQWNILQNLYHRCAQCCQLLQQNTDRRPVTGVYKVAGLSTSISYELTQFKIFVTWLMSVKILISQKLILMIVIMNDNNSIFFSLQKTETFKRVRVQRLKQWTVSTVSAVETAVTFSKQCRLIGVCSRPCLAFRCACPLMPRSQWLTVEWRVSDSRRYCKGRPIYFAQNCCVPLSHAMSRVKSIRVWCTKMIQW